jgi:sugar-specific transcriptional regulator TrmB
MASRSPSVLTPLGVTPVEEHVYRVLLANPGSTASEVTGQTKLGRHRVRGALDALEAKAMITRRAGTPAKFLAAPPDIVVEALISAREEELNRTRLDAHQLTALLRTSPDQVRVSELVEILTGPEVVVQRWEQMQRTARHSLEVFVKPPFAQPHLEEDEALQESLYDRGGVVRGLYDEQALQTPGLLEGLRRTIPRGEQARVIHRLPVKLALFDRRAAFVPLTQREPHATLVVHESALLDALIALFEAYWERAAPVNVGPEPEPEPENGNRRRLDEDAILTLLSAGLKDEAIARRLGVSTNTVRRRIGALSHQLGAETRFQMGLALGRTGWPEAPSS